MEVQHRLPNDVLWSELDECTEVRIPCDDVDFMIRRVPGTKNILQIRVNRTYGDGGEQIVVVQGYSNSLNLEVR